MVNETGLRCRTTIGRAVEAPRGSDRQSAAHPRSRSGSNAESIARPSPAAGSGKAEAGGTTDWPGNRQPKLLLMSAKLQCEKESTCEHVWVVIFWLCHRARHISLFIDFLKQRRAANLKQRRQLVCVHDAANANGGPEGGVPTDFTNAEQHMRIVEVLAKTRGGYTQKLIREKFIVKKQAI